MVVRAFLGVADSGGEPADAVGTEPRPGIGGGDDDGGLEVPEGHDVVAGLFVEADVDRGEFDTQFRERPRSCFALHARRLCINRDGGHEIFP